MSCFAILIGLFLGAAAALKHDDMRRDREYRETCERILSSCKQGDK
jgi:hypothetical protein